MIVAVQYYRPPFPEQGCWRRDLEDIKAAGVDAIQLWVTWGWVESTPGTFDFSDYDEIVSVAADLGLGVILSTIGEVHPFWIHREIPDSHMVDHRGRTVRSVARRENNAGLTPGGCTDNPKVRTRMGEFLTACAEHFATASNLLGWDAWNENRWAVHAFGHVCYCEHTLQAFRLWLQDRYGDLDGLNAAWCRRYVDWRDVNPGTEPKLMYTETVEFQRFLTWRAGRLMALRAAAIRSGDPNHSVTAHGVASSVFSPGQLFEQAVSRGNDWDHIQHLDGYGLSMYPDFFIDDEADFGARIESVRSAVGDKALWISEMEAAPTGVGFTAGRPVTGADLQRWLWTCQGRGASGVVLWQWYDERIGEESASFGLAGYDSLAADRMTALTELNAARRENTELLAGYRPDPGTVGVVFDEGAYYLGWSHGGAEEDLISGSVIGYLRALERLGVPYTVLDARHLNDESLESLRLVICPAPLMMTGAVSQMLTNWVRCGGHLVVETEVGSYSETGIYAYPEDRASARMLGIRGGGRDSVEDSAPTNIDFAGGSVRLRPQGWVEPVQIGGNNTGNDTTAYWSTGLLGEGIVMSVGTFAGLGYYRDRYNDFEDFVSSLVDRAGASGDLLIEEDNRAVLVRSGMSGARRLVFCTNPSDEAVTVTIRGPQTWGQIGDLCNLEAPAPAQRSGRLDIVVPARSTRVVASSNG